MLVKPLKLRHIHDLCMDKLQGFWSIPSVFRGCNRLQRLPITHDLSPSKESDKVAFWWTSIKEKPLKLF